MEPEPSSPRYDNVWESNDETAEPTPGFSRESPSAPRPNENSDHQTGTSSSLLDAVLRETIGVMTDEEAKELVDRWLAEQPESVELDLQACQSLVAYILSQRFRGWQIPDLHIARIAERLWEDPQAQERLRVIWTRATGR